MNWMCLFSQEPLVASRGRGGVEVGVAGGGGLVGGRAGAHFSEQIHTR